MALGNGHFQQTGGYGGDARGSFFFGSVSRLAQREGSAAARELSAQPSKGHGRLARKFGA